MEQALGLSFLGAGFGAGLIVFGAALGIGRLATSALEGMARQPESSGDLRTAMIIAAALIEGFTFFALVVTFMLATKTAPTTAVAPPSAQQQTAPAAQQ
jgi:F-type H+-transporting ATPase subunit c